MKNCIFKYFTTELAIGGFYSIGQSSAIDQLVGKTLMSLLFLSTVLYGKFLQRPNASTIPTTLYIICIAFSNNYEYLQSGISDWLSYKTEIFTKT